MNEKLDGLWGMRGCKCHKQVVSWIVEHSRTWLDIRIDNFTGFDHLGFSSILMLLCRCALVSLMILQ